MRLSEHFTLAELTRSQWAARRGVDNTPPPEVLEALRDTAGRMEQVRTLLGAPVTVSSGYRSPRVNAAVGGARASAHLTGRAVDFTCPAYGTPLEVCRAIEASDLAFDRLIHEFGAWTHLSFDPRARRQLLPVDRPPGARRSRTRPGLHR